MLHIRTAKKEDIPFLSQFISYLNRKSEHHIGYVSDDEQEIASSLEEVKDIEQSFLLALDGQKLVGTIGLDVNDQGQAEVWGPFIDHDHWAILVHKMWIQLLHHIDQRVHTLQFFINIENSQALSFLETIEAKRSGKHLILTCVPEQIQQVQQTAIREIEREDEQAFVMLHDQMFPNTYYQGEQILSRRNQHRKVWGKKINHKLIGYVYVEAEPTFGSASIEYFAVHPNYRGRGMGEELMTWALSWIFRFDEIQEVTLCVNKVNGQALHVYQKAGFSIVHELLSFEKQII